MWADVKSQRRDQKVARSKRVCQPRVNGFSPGNSLSFLLKQVSVGRNIIVFVPCLHYSSLRAFFNKSPTEERQQTGTAGKREGARGSFHLSTFPSMK